MKKTVYFRISTLDYQLNSLKNQHKSSENENSIRLSQLDNTTAALSLLEEENCRLQKVEPHKLYVNDQLVIRFITKSYMLISLTDGFDEKLVWVIYTLLDSHVTFIHFFRFLHGFVDF